MKGCFYLTGGSGFIGRFLLERLIADGNRVVVASRRPMAACMPSGVRTSIFDLEYPEKLKTADLEGVDTIIHIAARVHVMHPAEGEDRKLWQCNVVATEALGRAAVTAGVRRFIYASSIKVNGERTSDKRFAPTNIPAPCDAYGHSKLAAEEALKKLASTTGLEVAVIRPPLVYGPGVAANFRRLLSLVARGIPLPLNAVKNRRSLVSVWNLTDFIATVADHTGPVHGTWLVSDGDDLSTADLVRRIAAAMGRRARLFSVSPSILKFAGRMLGREAEVSRLCDSLQIDASGARRAFGWTPPLSVEESIERTVRWFTTVSQNHA
jgi:nucleoside-diphosphate-sugar epimerase